MNDIPLKKCTKCGGEFPATPEYFKEISLGGGWYRLGRQCRPCVAEQKREYRARYNPSHSEERKEYNKRWREANPEKAREQQRNWRQRNHKKSVAASHSWQMRNPEKMKIKKHRRRARKLGLPNTFTHDEWLTCLKWFGDKCAYCGKSRDDKHPLEAEHYIPLASPDCTGTVAGNMLPSCKSCNSSKGDKQPVEWINKKFKDRAAEILAHIQLYFDSL